MAKAAKKATAKVTYNGDLESVDHRGYTFPNGTAVEVDQDTARALETNQFFDVDGLEPADPAGSVSADEALAKERADHQAQIEAMQADNARQLEEQKASLIAGWQEQHDALMKENAELKAKLAPADQPQG